MTISKIAKKKKKKDKRADPAEGKDDGKIVSLNMRNVKLVKTAKE